MIVKLYFNYVKGLNFVGIIIHIISNKNIWEKGGLTYKFENLFL